MSESKKSKNEFDCLGEMAQNSLEEASRIQVELEVFNKQMNDRLLAVVQEFANLKQPLYDKRQDILQSVTNFWAIAFRHHPKLKLLINNSLVDDCLNYLRHVQVTEESQNGYQIEFTFNTNPYFYNERLIKSYSLVNDLFTGQPVSIEWKANINLCTNSSNSASKEDRKRTTPLENLFDWFTNSDTNDIICDIIRDDLWLDPLKYFFNSFENMNNHVGSNINEDCTDTDSEDDDNEHVDNLLDISRDEESSGDETRDSEK